MLDLCVIAVVALFTIWGFRRGLLRSVFSLASVVASLLLAWALVPVVTAVLNQTGLPAIIAGAMDRKVALPEFLGNTAVDVIIKIAALVLAFVLCKLILMVVGKLLEVIAKVPVIKQFNKLGGLIAGFLQGVLFCYIIFALLIIFTPLQNEQIQQSIDSSSISKTMYYDNWLFRMVNKQEVI